MGGDGWGVRSEGERLQDSGGGITCDAGDKVRLSKPRKAFTPLKKINTIKKEVATI